MGKNTTFIASIGGYNPQTNPLHQLSHHEQTTIFRLRAGHCGLKGHLKHLVFSPRLYVIVGKMIKHQITSCSHIHSTTEKGNTSGLSTTMNAKLWGPATYLHLTTHFATLTG